MGKPNQLALGACVRPVKTLEQPTGLIKARAFQVKQHAAQHRPHHQRRCDPATHRAHRREAEFAVDQHIVGRHVDDQPDKADQHGRLGARQPIGQPAQRQHQAYRWKAQGNRQQIVQGDRHQLRVDLHPDQHRAHQVEEQQTQQPENQPQPGTLAHQRAGLAETPGAARCGHLGGDDHHHPGEKQQRRNPEGVAQCHGRQRLGTDATGHRRIDKAQQRVRHLRSNDRQHQHNQCSQLCYNARPCGLGRCLVHVLTGCQKTSHASNLAANVQPTFQSRPTPCNTTVRI